MKIGMKIEIEVVENGLIIRRNGATKVFTSDEEAKTFILFSLHDEGQTWEEFKAEYSADTIDMNDIVAKKIER